LGIGCPLVVTCTTAASADASPNGLRYNVRRLADYPALSAYMQGPYRLPSIAHTAKPEKVRLHHDEPELPINPNIAPARAIAH
jgi:hypothetical protein